VDVAKLIEFLRGKKTYIIAAGAILTALGAYLNGTLSGPECVLAVLGACGLGTLRAGVTKAAAPLILLSSVLCPLALSACSTPLRTSYATVGTLGVTAHSAMLAWADWCKAGKADADEIATVERAYRAYAAAYNLAVDAGKSCASANDGSALALLVRGMAALESDLVNAVMERLPESRAAALKGGG
jgi:hypothetical protein